jgi:hypothetical protein
MPLRNHFQPPLSQTHPWRGFDSAWAFAIARHLNHRVLPEGCHAIPNLDRDTLVEVQVFYDEDGPRLMAAIELASPSNKDRPSERRAFAVKCLSYLHQGSGLVIIDTVTSRRANFHAEMMRLSETDQLAAWESPTGLYTVAYRTVEAGDHRQLQAWPHALALGEPLPQLPLWLGVDVCVPLDLEATYMATCEDLRIRAAG